MLFRSLSDVRTASAAAEGDDSDATGDSADGRDGTLTDATDAEGLAENCDWDEGPTAAESETPWSGPDDRDQDLSDPAGKSLRDHLLWQLEMTRLDDRKRALGRAIIDAIDEDGYFRDTLEQACAVIRSEFPEADADEAEAVLMLVQAFDPAGVGARSPNAVPAINRISTPSRRITGRRLLSIWRNEGAVVSCAFGKAIHD
mgnify:CR=1 FL=1